MMRGKKQSYFVKQALLVKSLVMALQRRVQLRKNLTRMILSVLFNSQVKTIRPSMLPVMANNSARLNSLVSMNKING